MDVSQIQNKASRIELRRFSTPQMRAFHLTWFAFFVAFFGWFGIAPLMPIIRDDLGLSKAQVGDTIIASVAITVVARLLIGWLSDRFGPRVTYAWLLILGSLPVMGIGLAQSYETFLLFRLAIGAIGASFVITQYHTSIMFAPNVVGTANATTAGWGNLGGGGAQLVMPLILAVMVSFGASEALGWRLAMIAPGVALLISGVLYYLLTQDAPNGNYRELRAAGELPPSSATRGSFVEAAKDGRVWALFLVYSACFGMALTINNVAALYYHDRFGLGLTAAGAIAALFGLMNLFARTLGGIFGDRAGIRWGLRGRVWFLAAVLLLEGLALIVFSRMSVVVLSVPAMVVFSLFVQMSAGATYSVVPFINQRALGSVAGIVGAGGNAGAVAAGFLFRTDSLSPEAAFLILGGVVTVVAPVALLVRFSAQDEAEGRRSADQTLRERTPPPRAAPRAALAAE